MVRYAAGDGEAFEQLFARYEARAYGYFLRRTGAAERARDLYQELFLRLHRARDRYDPGRPFTPWFFQIAHRLLVDDYRRAFRSREVSSEGRDTPSSDRGTEQVLANRQQLLQLLGELTPEERHVVVSAKLEGMDYGELAEQLGKSVDAVKKMASRALRRLRGIARRDAELEFSGR